MRKVVVVAEDIRDGSQEEIHGYRVRSEKQLRALERKLSEVLAAYNQRIVLIR